MRSARSSSDGLAQVRVYGLTRGAFIVRGALATAAAYGAGAVAPFVTRALAQSDASDAQVLDFALRLEILESKLYDQALKQVPGMGRSVRSVLSEVRGHEHEHQRILRATLGQLGVRTSPDPKVEFGDAFSSESRFLEIAKQLEDTGVEAYNGAAPMIFDRDALVEAAEIAHVDARHAAVVADLQDQPVAPGAFERALKPAEVDQRIKRYVR
jgi:ferritin-like protein